MNMSEIKQLALAITKNKTNKGVVNFSIGGEETTLSLSAMNETLRESLQELSSGRNAFARNKYDIFEIIQESVDAKLPVELGRWMNGFAKVTAYGINDKPEITIRKPGKNLRGRSFVTLGTPAGHYEVFRLAGDNRITVNMTAATGAIQIAYEDFLTGRVDWNELVETLMMGVEDRIYDQVVAAFGKLESSLPTVNKGTSSAFDPEMLNDLIGITEAYGASATILCTARFARAITEGAEWASEAEKVARREVGYLTNYKGAKVVVLPNSFVDETNGVKVLDDSKAYIIPAGQEPIVHVALQGGLQMKDENNADWSIELHAYQKFGVAAVANSAITIYEISGLKA